MGIVEERKDQMDKAWRRRQRADIVYGIGTVLSGVGAILLTVGKMRKHG